MEEEKALEGITPQQQKFIAKLLLGKNIRQAALAVGISRRTATYWLHSGPVRREYDLQRMEQSQTFHTRISKLHERALAALEYSLSDDAPPGIRFQAAKFLYEAHLQASAAIEWPESPDHLVAQELKAAYSVGLYKGNALGLYDDNGRERLPESE